MNKQEKTMDYSKRITPMLGAISRQADGSIFDFEITSNEIIIKDLIKAEEQTNLDICAGMMLDNKITP